MPPMDRISCLPDEVICHILSFVLPTKLTAQTSVLSKRWRFLWARVPSLEFSFGFGYDDTYSANITTKILLQHKHDIHTFCLFIGEPYVIEEGFEEEFQSWIENITTRNIRNLVLFIDIQIVLPQCLFTCKTLVDFLLMGCIGIPRSGVYFPALKKLKLENLECECHESLANLISGCPVLEELIIEGIRLPHYCVSSPTLTRLQLRLGGDELFSYEIFSFGVKLDTPALRYLLLCGYMLNEFSLGALDSLIEADISLYWDEELQENFIYSRSVLAFVGKLHNVKVLNLSIDGQISGIYDSGFSSLAVKLPNLTKLTLYSNLGFISFFLGKADNLKVLELKPDLVEVDNQFGWVEPKQVPTCLISHLQIVDVQDFRCSEHEFEMVRYILMNAKALKMMKIRTPLNERDCKKKLKALKRLTYFERGSQDCRLVFK